MPRPRKYTCFDTLPVGEHVIFEGATRESVMRALLQWRRANPSERRRFDIRQGFIEDPDEPGRFMATKVIRLPDQE